MSRRIEVEIIGDTSRLEAAFARLAERAVALHDAATERERRGHARFVGVTELWPFAFVAVPLALALLIGWFA